MLKFDYEVCWKGSAAEYFLNNNGDYFSADTGEYKGNLGRTWVEQALNGQLPWEIKRCRAFYLENK